MIQIIAGEKGKGKTKILIDKVNVDVKESKGSIVYLDKNTKHMYELNNKIRLINVRDYCVEDPNEFSGFICGLISGDHDLQKIYLDSFLKLACASKQDIERLLQKIELIATKFEVDFVISISVDKEDLPEFAKKYVVVSL
ncbi:twitching motility protein PilT [Clostridium sp. Marseille-P299]|uniref:twitching motility protein PilT n=1 Tax=Clostridium sp. Marseille-P299 TaxID=1805477 RepID=UPI00082F807D|nr:twitching motility protein PilT [Clostridium sp. Marseille-P299]